MRVAQATNALFPVMMEILDFKRTRWFEKHEPHLAGFERLVRVDCERLHLAVTEGAPLVMKPSFYGALRLEPMRADVCVVKSFLPFRLYVAFENRETIDARNLGLMRAGVERLRASMADGLRWWKASSSSASRSGRSTPLF